MTAVFEARDVRKTFTIKQGLFKPKKPLHAVNGVSFKLEKGSVLGLVGESDEPTPANRLHVLRRDLESRSDRTALSKSWITHEQGTSQYFIVLYCIVSHRNALYCLGCIQKGNVLEVYRQSIFMGCPSRACSDGLLMVLA